MLKIPQSIIYAMIAVNITGFALLLQLDLLTLHSTVLKIVSWVATAALWALAYQKRKRYFTLF